LPIKHHCTARLGSPGPPQLMPYMGANAAIIPQADRVRKRVITL
jgi:hypothetical protein